MGTVRRVMVALVGAVGVMAAVAVPAQAEEPRAIVNGLAWAAGVDLPVEVAPNVEVAPVFSYSNITNGESHGISAGFWPGDILHAFADVYGYGDPARSMMGIAESLWPDRPEDSASTSDFGDKCRHLALFADHGVPKEFTDFFTSGCYTFWEQTRAYYPYEAATGTSSSKNFYTAGSAGGVKMKLPNDINIEEVHSTSSSDARSGKTISDSTLVYRNVHIGDLTIEQIRSVAHAESNGKAGGITAHRDLQVIGANVAGTPVSIGAEGVKTLEDTQSSDTFKSVQARLADQGFDVRLIQGTATTGNDQADAISGGLVVRIVRQGASAEQVDPACSQLYDVYPQPITTLGPFDVAGNPLYKDVFPENQLPPRLGVDQSLPPPFLCPLRELVRSADVAVVLGTTVAQARFVPLPNITIDRNRPEPPRIITRTVTIPGSGGGGPTPVVIGPKTLPRSDGNGPVAVVDPMVGVAAKVKLLYGMLVALVGALLAGRSTFRNLIRM